jgi:FkbM family methyltransferase
MPFFLPSLKKNGHLDRVDMTVCNVGSRKVTSSDDYGTQGWQVFAPNLTIYGFDADSDACEAANAEFEARNVNWNEFHLPIAIAKEVGTSTLYVTKNPMCSSLYPPNEEFLKRFPRLPHLAGLDFTTPIETTTLDTFCQTENVDGIDFLQIDVQGAELQVLEGATALLEKSVLAIQLEVEFSPLYVGQPLFSDLDPYLRRQGFALFDLIVAREQRSPLVSTNRPGQAVWGEAIYIRDLLQDNAPPAFQTPDHMFKLACIADTLEFTDYALELLKHLTSQSGNESRYNFTDTIVESLSAILSPEQVELEVADLK